jgi:adenosylmethionine-8-amino-7-oxononanoate aminotransferase
MAELLSDIARTRRRKLISLRGDSHASAAHVLADRPPPGFYTALDDTYTAHLEDVFARHADEASAVIVEPVVQAAGMRFYSPDVVARLLELCDRYDVSLVLDETVTGLGRTGKPSAYEHAGVVPDEIVHPLIGTEPEMLVDDSWRDDVARIERGLCDGLAGAWNLRGVVNVRVLGAIGVVQLDRPVDARAAMRAALERGVWLRPSGDAV